MAAGRAAGAEEAGVDVHDDDRAEKPLMIAGVSRIRPAIPRKR